MGLRTQGTLRELFIDVPLADARPITAPIVDARYTLANNWANPTIYRAGGDTIVEQRDEQADALALSIRVPLSAAFAGKWSERTWASLDVRGTHHGGGWSDGPIEWWHGVVGAFNSERDTSPRDEVHLALNQEGGPTAFDLSRPVVAINDPVLRAQVALIDRPTTDRAVAITTAIKLPIGRLAALGGSGGLDATVGVVGTARLTPWLMAHGMVSISGWSRWSSDIAIRPRTLHAAFHTALVAHWGYWSVIIEDSDQSPILRNGWVRDEWHGGDGYLSSAVPADFRAHNQISAGVRGHGVTLWFCEDETPGSNPRSVLKWLYNDNAPDIVIGLGWTGAIRSAGAPSR